MSCVARAFAPDLRKPCEWASRFLPINQLAVTVIGENNMKFIVVGIRIHVDSDHM